MMMFLLACARDTGDGAQMTTMGRVSGEVGFRDDDGEDHLFELVDGVGVGAAGVVYVALFPWAQPGCTVEDWGRTRVEVDGWYAYGVATAGEVQVHHTGRGSIRSAHGAVTVAPTSTEEVEVGGLVAGEVDYADDDGLLVSASFTVPFCGDLY